MKKLLASLEVFATYLIVLAIIYFGAERVDGQSDFDYLWQCVRTDFNARCGGILFAGVVGFLGLTIGCLLIWAERLKAIDQDENLDPDE